MNAPILRLHMNASGEKFNINNSALSADEQINLRLNNQIDEDIQGHANQLAQGIYSLEDLFNMPTEETRNNVYAVINATESINDE